MKVLKLKDPAKFKDIITKRGNNVILFTPDNDGNYIVGFEVLTDPVYADLVEDILDQCEVVEYNPLSFEIDEKPIKQSKGEFATILASAKDIEEAVILYYDSKKGIITKYIVDPIVSASKAVVNFFTPTT